MGTRATGRRTAAQRTGAWGEAAAAAVAEAAGARIVARNVTCRWGELDLVLLERGVLAFAEVKTRRREGPGAPSARDAVGATKRGRLARAALWFLSDRGLDPSRVRCRFDVFEVRPGPRGPEVTWLRDAFEVDR
jgi:putative endonuclease